MNKALPVSLIISTLVAPAFVLAEQGPDDRPIPPPPPGAVRILERVRANVELIRGRPPHIENDDANEQEDIDDDAAPTPREIRERIREHMASTTIPLPVRHRIPTTTRERIEESAQEARRDVPSFFRRLLGLPATTTIGDIRAELQASTTIGASTTIPRPPQGIGFLRNFFQGFGKFFRGSDD